MILCENGPDGRFARFNPRDVVVARAADEVAPALARLDAARAAGAWVAGWMAYEAGYALEPRLARLMPADPGPLLAFGICDAPSDAVLPDGAGKMSMPRPVVTRDTYDAAFAQVAAFIAAGDCYQINLTFPMTATLTSGSALGLYAALRGRQAVGHGGFADFGAAADLPVMISRSPELFFRTDAAGRIVARPMKGTAPRHPDPVRDQAIIQELSESEKVRAENLMIVDLLRNDIGRISQIGSVRVPELYAVESFATLHQMSSRVEGVLTGPPLLSQLMPALFPCGSVTGAPKIRAMEIIHELEPFPRGLYCGAFGWMGPDGASSFNVTIRTLSLWGDRITMNVGGGVVADSTAQGEWEEALWKARFAMPQM
ncbi:aminodeoxychorismate synthase component I [Szabonella alba]|uniref:aminodeoxychorismate synthase component I n=1 Tax=Szabonella alba TaxID=2804194 RepID=UPI003B586149